MKKFSTIFSAFLFTFVAAQAHAAEPLPNEIVPKMCAEEFSERVRALSKKYCLNKVGATDLEVLSIEARINEQPSGEPVLYYVVTQSIDVPAQQLPGGPSRTDLTPAHRRKRLEPATVLLPATAQDKISLESLDFTQPFGNADSSDARKEIFLMAPDNAPMVLNPTNEGLRIFSGANFTDEEKFDAGALSAVPTGQ